MIVEALDGMIRYQGAQDSHRLCLESALEAPVQEIAAAAGAELQQWLLGLVNSPEHRLAGAQQMADSLAEHLRDLSRQAGEAIHAATNELRSLKELLLGDKKGSKNWLRFRGFFSRRRLVADRRLSEYFELRLHELTLNAFCRLVGLVLAQVATVGDKLRNLAADFNRLIEQFSAAPAVADESTVRTQGLAAGRRRANRRPQDGVARRDGTGLGGRSSPGGDDRNPRRPQQAGRRRAADVANAHPPHAEAVCRGRGNGGLGRPSARAALRDPRRAEGSACRSGSPPAADSGGCWWSPPSSSLPAVAAQAPRRRRRRSLPTVLADAGSDMLVCYEVEDQPLRRIAAKVLDQRFQAVEVAARLHTRTDVPWTPL